MPDRVALVTGASGGLGSAIASRLAADGFFVLLHYRSPSRMVESAAEAIRAAGGRCAAIAGDLGTSSGIETFLQQTGNTLAELALEKLDVLAGKTGRIFSGIGNCPPFD